MRDDRFTNLRPDQLPSLPAAAVRLLELSRSPDATIQDICDAIRSDPAIAARVIKAANSSYFGLRSEVTSIDKAAVLLGASVLTTITLTFCLADDSISDTPHAENYRAYWLRVVVQAAAADTILTHYSSSRSNSAFLAGLLCDVGQLAMLKVDAAAFGRLVSKARETVTPILQLESEEFGTNHLELGVLLAEKWQLPKTLLDAIKFHHVPPEELSQNSDIEDWPMMKAVVVASAAGDHICGSGVGDSWKQLQTACHSLFELDDDQVLEFLGRVHAGASELSNLFDVDARALPDPELLISQAREQLIECTFEVQSASREAESHQQQLKLANEQLARQNEDLQNRVITDQLTEVYSRSFFEECLRKEVRKSGRTHAPVAVAFCDIDHFKDINDKYGHQLGDEVLRSVAQALRESVRSSDVLARYGGEEFVAILPGQDPERIENVTERMRRAVQDLRLTVNGQRLRVSISVGACTLVPGEGQVGDQSERLVVEADKAMYCAKRSGRNQTRTQVLELADVTTAEQKDDPPIGAPITVPEPVDKPNVNS